MRIYIKIFIFLAIIISTVGGLSAWLSGRILTSEMERSLEDKATIIVKSFSDKIAQNVLDGEILPVREFAQSLVKESPTVEYIYIIGFESQLFMHTFENGFPKALAHNLGKHTHPDKDKIVRYNLGEIEVLEIENSLIEGLPAHVYLGMNESNLLQRVHDVKRSIYLVTLGVALFGLIILKILNKRITRPLNILTNSMREYGKGEINHILKLQHADWEVMEISNAFNEMIQMRQQYEQKLSENEIKFRDFIEGMDDLVVQIDNQGKIIYANEAWNPIIGLSGKESAGYPVLDCVHPEDRDKTAKIILGQTENRTDSGTLENRLIHADGTVSHMLWTINNHYDKDGSLLFSNSIGRDITERKNYEESLAESEERFVLFMDNVPGAAFIKNEEGTYIYTSKGFHKSVKDVIGIDETNWIGKSDSDFLPPEVAENIRWNDLDVLKSGKLKNLTEIVPTSNGLSYWMSYKFPISTKDGKEKLLGSMSIDITEQKKVEEALKESEFNLNKAQEMALVGSWDLDLRTNKLNWSDEVYRIFGLSPQEFEATYEAFIEAIHPDDREMVAEKYARSVENKTPYESIHRVLRPDGDIRIVHERSENIFDNEGIAIRSVGTIQDITELEEATQTLKREMNHFDKLLESLGDVVFIVKLPERVIERVNFRIESVFGYDASECIGNSTKMLYEKEEDYEEFGKTLQEATKKGEEVVYINQKLLKKDGNTFDSEITVSFLRENGEISHVISVIRDISELISIQTELEKAHSVLEDRVKERTLELESSNKSLIESEERFRKIFEASPLGMAIVGIDKKLLKLNKRFCEMLEYTEEELLGRTIMEITHPDYLDETKNAAERQFSGKISYYQQEKGYLKKSGETLWANLTSSMLLDNEGKPLYGIAMVEDIGERKIADQKILNSLKEKEVLLKEIHHRVKNNLQVISSLLNLQARGIKDKKTAKQLLETKNRIMSMSLIHESLYQSENLAEVNIPSYISMLTDNVLQTYAEDRSKIQISQKIEKISLDLNASIPLGLIVTELVTNSIHHAFTGSKKGKITITFSSEQNNFELSVRDNGKGIPSGFLVEESNSLGLKLVKMLTEQLNGNLELNTKGGTEYKIKFKI